LRRRFPAPIEPKVEKVHIENQLAEQTITESLTDPLAPIATVGFKPRFKAGVLNKPIEEEPQPDKVSSTKQEDKPSNSVPPTAFRPRFKAAMVNTPATEKPAEEASEVKAQATGAVSEEANGVEDKPVDTPAKPAVGFKPRFKASMVSKPAENKPAENKPAGENIPEQEIKKEEPTKDAPAETAPKPMGFKPRFKAKE